MILRRFYDDNLAQASYLVGCSASGEAIIIDPNREVAQYLDAAKREDLRITHVTETHIHADFLSGLRELAAATGAMPYLSGCGGADWQYAFAAGDGARLLADGDTFMVGNIRIEALHTPGHTPEHITFMVTDTAGADRPMGAFTGDFIFAGDVGRPDLLEKAAGVTGTMEAAARELFASLQNFKRNDDYLQLWPGHGAGSACGKALGAVPQTTLGYERRFNWALAETSEDTFVGGVLFGQPDPPRYFAQMKRMNRAGPPLLRTRAIELEHSHDALQNALDAGHIVVDTRAWNDFANEHIAGTVSIPLNKTFSTWAGWLLPYDQPLNLIAADTECAHRAVRELSMIGLDSVEHIFASDVIAAARAAGRVQRTSEIDVATLAAAVSQNDTTIIDVRNETEWQEGHIPDIGTGGATILHIPLGHLQDLIAEVPRDGRVFVHCKAGGRSAIATSILERNGIPGAVNVRGGFDAWRMAGLPDSGHPNTENS